jgi:hypothetical protein
LVDWLIVPSRLDGNDRHQRQYCCWLSNFGLQENIKCPEFSSRWVWMLPTHQGPIEKFKGIIGERILLQIGFVEIKTLQRV